MIAVAQLDTGQGMRMIRCILTHHLVPEVALVPALLRVARLLPAELPRNPLALGLRL